MDNQKSPGCLPVLWGFIAIAALIPFVIGLALWLNQFCKLDDNPTLDALGAYGSYLQGAVASLWALAGVILVGGAFFAQTHQLKLQRKQIAEQEAQFRQQNFETSFFQLLAFHNEIAKQAKATFDREFGGKKISSDTVEGRYCFKEFRDKMSGIYSSPKERQAFILTLYADAKEIVKIPPERELSLSAYSKVHQQYQDILDHYFRNLYHVIKFVSEGKIGDKRRYTSIARAQLSAYELVLLFYNGISEYGEKFHPLIEEFGLFEHLDETLLMNPSHRHEKWYDEKAFH